MDRAERERDATTFTSQQLHPQNYNAPSSSSAEATVECIKLHGHFPGMLLAAAMQPSLIPGMKELRICGVFVVVGTITQKQFVGIAIRSVDSMAGRAILKWYAKTSMLIIVNTQVKFLINC
ncbi:hypothetical protein PR048_025168 [Dryococelus australis]|uniref:Uncharacterized protein n=1 Tax=Dryococelus australis TaxID=614101 RepID=A0ABQ9GQI5_9NEOP|nr:hypothetical protein PR048_025168 [Dryococelus australis]